ncbi:RING/FYVE/PHD zinc finger superfamily protein [Striga asiatica]|uniref:RING/FYVE/PHD zinc finger superfamily protein n=1 Tax=Striga asiatica TaxID=4170 RepID=A0A5A7QG56_STRAF|nr:RING/FYVE/PHD zinc finger superfamily protein [Striga asiatica]
MHAHSTTVNFMLSPVRNWSSATVAIDLQTKANKITDCRHHREMRDVMTADSVAHMVAQRRVFTARSLAVSAASARMTTRGGRGLDATLVGDGGDGIERPVAGDRRKTAAARWWCRFCVCVFCACVC